ncbi:hypothetical protein Q5H91_07940, partial [Sphingomonas sp. KR1UV-12]
MVSRIDRRIRYWAMLPIYGALILIGCRPSSPNDKMAASRRTTPSFSLGVNVSGPAYYSGEPLFANL